MHKKLGVVVFLLIICLLRTVAQPAVGGVGAGRTAVLRVSVLPDRGYSWDQVRTDATLAFTAADSLRPAQARRFWLRLTLHNRSRYTEAVRLRVLPNLANTLYYFDEDARAWQTRPMSTTLAGWQPLLLPSGSSTCYIRVSLPAAASVPRAISWSVRLVPAAEAQASDRLVQVVWGGALAVLGLLGLAALIAYARSRDRATLYYIVTQLGAALYITSFTNYFKSWLPTPVFSMEAVASGQSYAHNPSHLLMHLGVALLLGGLGQMTRAYLRTPARLPRLDTALRYAVSLYCAFTLGVLLVNGSGYYVDSHTLPFHNLLALVVIVLVLGTTVVAVRRGLPAARPYLLANALPLLLSLIVAGNNVAVGASNDPIRLLPSVAVVAHALCFAVALGVRLHRLQRTLLTTEREAQSLALDIQAKELRHREIVLKSSHIQAALRQLEQQQQAREQHTRQLSADNEQHQSTNQDLREQLEANQRELASTTLYVQQKNALLAELRQQIRELSPRSPAAQGELSGIKSILQSSLYLDEDWSKFKLHFEQVHPRFFEELQARYPALTKHEQRLYCYFHIHLSTKEIAALLNIDPASVRRAKTRLYKKMTTADQAAGRTPPPEPPVEA